MTYLEGNENLWDSAGRWRDSREVELAQVVVVLGESSLALEHSNRHRVLVVGRRREDLRLLGGRHRVTRDQRGHHAS